MSMARLHRTKNYRDFRLRIKRIDPVYYRWGERGAMRDTTEARPVPAAFLGFGWAYLVAAIAGNRGYIESSLRQGSLDSSYHGWIMMGLAALIAASLVMFGLHLFRFLLRKGGKKRNSGGLLVGALGALMLVYTPASVWSTGYGLLDQNSRSLLLTASSVGDKIDMDIGKVTFVSSNGQ